MAQKKQLRSENYLNISIKNSFSGVGGIGSFSWFLTDCHRTPPSPIYSDDITIGTCVCDANLNVLDSHKVYQKNPGTVFVRNKGLEVIPNVGSFWLFKKKSQLEKNWCLCLHTHFLYSQRRKN